MKRTICALITAAQLAACTTLSPAYRPTGDGAGLNRGDRIHVTLRDATTHRVEVTRVSPDAVCGGEECFAFSEIDLLQREEVDAWRTAGLVAGIALFAGFIIAIRSATFPIGAWQ